MLQRSNSINALSPLEKVSHTLGAVIVVATVAGGGMFLFSKPNAAHAERVEADRRSPGAQVAQTSGAGALSDPTHAAPLNGVRRIPLIGGVDPTPPSAPKAYQEPVRTVPVPGTPGSASPEVQPVTPTPVVAAAAPSVLTGSAGTPTGCLPAGFQTVLRDVEAKFGPMTLVSTTELHTDNHSPGSVRHKPHTACRAVDFKIRSDAKAVTAYLRSRSEIAGVTTFGNNGVIHIDYSEPRRVAQR